MIAPLTESSRTRVARKVYKYSDADDAIEPLDPLFVFAGGGVVVVAWSVVKVWEKRNVNELDAEDPTVLLTLPVVVGVPVPDPLVVLAPDMAVGMKENDDDCVYPGSIYCSERLIDATPPRILVIR